MIHSCMLDGAMRHLLRIRSTLVDRALVGRALVGVVALVASGCVIEDETGAAASASEPVCADLLVQERCFDCLETSCCEEVRTCIDDTQGCAACIQGDADACTAEAAVKLYACLLGSCQVVCGEGAPGPSCDAPAEAPSGGSCAPIGEQVECNPITNEGCDGAAGEACDYDAGRFRCYAPPNEVAACQPCGDDQGFCGAGLTCFQSVQVSVDGVSIQRACARSCCEDGDCGSGVCTETVEASGARVGVCLERGSEQ